MDPLELEVTAAIWHWRGPSPFHFVPLPEAACAQLQEVARSVTYGWGMVPAQARLGVTAWTTSLFPEDGGYLLPVKDAVRRAEQVDDGDVVTVQLRVAGRGR